MTATSSLPAPAPLWRLAVISVVVGLAVGVLTSLTQGWLPDGFASLANSAGPWSLAAFAVALFVVPAVRAGVAGWLVLACCELGYVLGGQIRDVPNSSSTVAFWLFAALLAGPVLGVAATWTRGDRPERVGLGVGVVAGVLCGEGLYGWTTLADTTSSAYWVGEIVVGLVVLGALIWWRRQSRAVVAACFATIVVGALLYVAARTV